MIIGRRTFIRLSALLAAAPAFAGLLSISLSAKSRAASLSHPAQCQRVAGNVEVIGAEFRIEGWDQRTDPSGEHVLIRINQAWKAAWR